MGISTNSGGTLEYVTTGETFRHFQVMSNALHTPKQVVCPADVRQPAKDFQATFGNTNISYFVGVDAVEPEPPEYRSAYMLLSGDDNFAIGGVPLKSGLLELTANTPVSWTATRHHFAGNVGFPDGSVLSLANSNLLNQIRQTGLATNRLAIP